ncbi:hypothetical protein BU15DRAFT_80518 [Melanogaster broomeanus]|nr:hypothetical protein BU15DRAFT_80518 [Melanogaster broomeanus]
MSLFKWSTPERRSGDRDLRIIPNEIYLTIFEHIAPTSARLSLEQLKMFTNLSLVCRFFGNLCLPRVFEYVEIPGFGNRAPLTRDGSASRGKMLCQHIAAKEPLALALAECVKVCHVIRLAILASKTRRISKCSRGYTKPGWQKLCYHSCDFLESPVGIDPDKKVKVPCLEAIRCTKPYRLYAAVDARHLRTLVIDMTDADFGYETDWLSLSGTAVTELRIYSRNVPAMRHIRHLQEILHHTAHSLQALTLLIHPFSDVTQVLFEDPAWRNMPHLRSLTLQVRCRHISPMAVIRRICDGIRVHGGLQSFSVQDIVHEELDCIPGLNFVEIGGTSVCLVDGKWIDAEGYAS